MSSVPRTPSRMPEAGAPVSQPIAANPARNQVSPAPCVHPRVQIVAREEDSEFVECLECREIFEASEFRDMQIEEKIDGAEEE